MVKITVKTKNIKVLPLTHFFRLMHFWRLFIVKILVFQKSILQPPISPYKFLQFPHSLSFHLINHSKTLFRIENPLISFVLSSVFLHLCVCSPLIFYYNWTVVLSCDNMCWFLYKYRMNFHFIMFLLCFWWWIYYRNCREGWWFDFMIIWY